MATYVHADELLRVIDAVYAASCDPEAWPDALCAIADLVGGTGANLLFHDRTDQRGGIFVSVRTDPEATAAYVQHYHRVDPWATNAKSHHFQIGRVVPSQLLVPHAELVKTEFYAGIGRPYGLSRALTASLERSDKVETVVSFNRSDRHEEFGEREVALLSTLIPHLRRALHVQRLIGDRAAERDTLGEILEHLEIGVLLCTDPGAVSYANREARRLADLRDGFGLSPDGPLGASPRETAKLRTAVRSVLARTSPGEALVLPRPSGEPDLQVLVRRLARSDTLRLSHAGAEIVLLIRDPSTRKRLAPDLLQTYFGLTPAEARFAAHLAEGMTPREISDSLRLSRTTTRWTLERLRAKTGARSQAQTVTRLLKSLARL